MKSIISFTAKWCPNCPRMKPVLEKLGEDYDVTIVDVDDNPDAAKTWGVMSLPTTLIIDEQNNVLERAVGAKPYSFMLDLLKD